MPFSSGFVTERTPAPAGAAREDGARLEDGEVLEDRPGVPLGVRQARRARRTGDSPFGEAVRSAFHWKKRATGGFAPPSAADRHPGRPGGVGLLRVARRAPRGRRRRSRGHAPLAAEAAERREAQGVLDGRGERAGEPDARRRVAGFPATPIVTTAKPGPAAGIASDQLLAGRGHEAHVRGPSTRRRGRAGPSRRGALRSASRRRPRIDSSGKSQAGSTKPSGWMTTISELLVDRGSADGRAEDVEADTETEPRGASSARPEGAGVGVGVGRRPGRRPAPAGRPRHRSATPPRRATPRASTARPETSGREKSCSVRGLPSGRSATTRPRSDVPAYTVPSGPTASARTCTSSISWKSSRAPAGVLR